jgi:hypothetical protein
MLTILVWWFISAHKWFKGPVINVGHHMIGRDETLEGIEHSSSTDGNSLPDKKVLEASTPPIAELR